MELLTGFPDAELVVMALLDPVGTTVTATSDTDEPVIRVNRTGGENDRISDYPVIEVACFAPDRGIQGSDQPPIPGRSLAWKMSEQCRQIILAAGRTTVTYVDPEDPTATEVTALIDSARNSTPPDQLPYGNESIRTVIATYRLSLRRPRA
jgi:hypothetical protein